MIDAHGGEIDKHGRRLFEARLDEAERVRGKPVETSLRLALDIESKCLIDHEERRKGQKQPAGADGDPPLSGLRHEARVLDGIPPGFTTVSH